MKYTLATIVGIMIVHVILFFIFIGFIGAIASFSEKTVTVKNNSNTSVIYDISLTALSGAKTPNLDAVKMASNISVASVTSIKGVNKGICTTSSIAGGGTSTACYFMVFITNLNSAQTDSGAFTGTVTAVGSNGAEVKAQF